MGARNKNPLYVVKGDQVQAADNFIDMLIKKLNLEPFIELMMGMFKMLLENVSSYPMFVVIKEMLDHFLARLELFKKFAIV